MTSDRSEPVWYATVGGVRREVRRRRRGLFVKGPIPLGWIRAVSRTRATLCLGLYLWFKRGLGESPIKVSPGELCRGWGLRSRRSVYGALAELEAAGLIVVDRRAGRCARVVLKRVPCE